jgi:transcriptional regulator with XRE-family HTH domain
VPARRSPLRPPVEYLVSGVWPAGRLGGGAPREARLAQGIARRLRTALAGRTLREVAGEAGLSPQTVANLLHGRSWGDMVTLARLETVLQVALWGDEHRDR